MSLRSATREATAVGSPCAATREKPTQQRRPSTAKKKEDYLHRNNKLPSLRPPFSRFHGSLQTREPAWPWHTSDGNREAPGDAGRSQGVPRGTEQICACAASPVTAASWVQGGPGAAAAVAPRASSLLLASRAQSQPPLCAPQPSARLPGWRQLCWSSSCVG